MLCDRIDPYLRWMRLAHDIIEGGRAKCFVLVAYVAHTLLPTMHAAAVAFACRSLALSREVLVLSRLLLYQASAILGKSALALVGVSVAIPQPRSRHAAEFSVGASSPWWRRLAERLRLFGFKGSNTFYAGVPDRIVHSDVFEPHSATSHAASAHSSPRFSTEVESDAVLFPSSSVDTPQSSARHRARARDRSKATNGSRLATVSVEVGGSVAGGGEERVRERRWVGLRNRLAECVGIIRSVDILI